MSTADVPFVADRLANAFLGQLDMGMAEQVKFVGALKRVFRDPALSAEVLETVVARIARADPALADVMRRALGECVAGPAAGFGLTPTGE